MNINLGGKKIIITNNIILNKYRIQGVLGNGSGVTVYLVRHCVLMQQRIIKCIDKSNKNYKFYIKEIKYLNQLRHAAIPVLYDIEEDDIYCYIVEEYIEGLSFKELFVHKNVELKDIIDFFIQLSYIFYFLHEQKPYPIVYLDLKPEHVVFSSKGICLLDFGGAVELKGAEISGNCMGTEGFAAPELIEGGYIDERSDVYSIGALLYWCLTGKVFIPEKEYDKLNDVLTDYPLVVKEAVIKCLQKYKENRFKSVIEFAEKLNLVCNYNKKKSSFKIAVVGSQPRVGVTHFCMSLVCYLNLNHRKCLYEEKTDSAILSVLCENDNNFCEAEGIVRGKNFYGLPKYGSAVAMEGIDYDVVVQDCGCLSDAIVNIIDKADFCIFLGGIKSWEIMHTGQIIKRSAYKDWKEKSCIVLFGVDRKHNYSSYIFNEKRIYFMPFSINPFKPNKELNAFFNHLSKTMGFTFVIRKRFPIKGIFITDLIKNVCKFGERREKIELQKKSE